MGDGLGIRCNEGELQMLGLRRKVLNSQLNEVVLRHGVRMRWFQKFDQCRYDTVKTNERHFVNHWDEPRPAN
jgi:hypothetical protein